MISAPVEISSELALRKPFSEGVIVLEIEGKDRYRTWLKKELASQNTTVTQLEGKQ